MDGGSNRLCLPIALNNSEILEKNPDNTFKLYGFKLYCDPPGLKTFPLFFPLQFNLLINVRSKVPRFAQYDAIY